MEADPTRNRHRRPRPGLPAGIVAQAHEANAQGSAPAHVRAAGPGLVEHATVHELLIATQQQAHTVDESLRQLVRLLDVAPPAMQSVQLDATTTERQVPGTAEFRSLGIYTPSDATIYVGLGGDPARPGVGALQVPARSAVVLPVPGELVSVGAAAADLTTPAIVWLFRYSTVQPMILGAVA